MKNFNQMPSKEYDGETPVVIFNSDKYFFCIEDIENYCKKDNIKPEDLRLVFCEPIYFHRIEPNDIYDDILPDGYTVEDVSKELSDAFNNLNKIISKKIIAGWAEGNTRVSWN